MMNVETIQARAMSADVSGNVSDLVAEAATLRSFLADYRTRLDAAAEAFDSACEFCLPTDGVMYTVWAESFWRYPAVQAAYQAYEALKDDSLAYWAQARLRDLDSRLGMGWNPQMTLGL